MVTTVLVICIATDFASGGLWIKGTQDFSVLVLQLLVSLKDCKLKSYTPPKKIMSTGALTRFQTLKGTTGAWC